MDAAGTMITPYTCTRGDETILLLEGEVDVVETLSGKTHSFRAKFWSITGDELPA